MLAPICSRLIIVEQFVDVEQNTDLIVHFSHAFQVATGSPFSGFWWRLDILFRNVCYLVNLVHHQSYSGFVDVDNNNTGAFVIIPLRQVEAESYVHHRNNLATEVDYPLDKVRHVRHLGDLLDADDLGDKCDVQTIILTGQVEGEIFIFLGVFVIIEIIFHLHNFVFCHMYLTF